MKNLIKFFSIIGLLSMSQFAVAIDNVEDGDVLTADTMNELIDVANEAGLGFDIVNPCGIGGGGPYSVGDAGPSGAGGLVFFVTADGCNGLEASPSPDQGVGSWGCVGVEVGAGGQSIGDGGPNTLAIVDNGCATPGNSASLTRAYMGGGENDWYLPSIDELVEMCKIIGPGAANAGNFMTAAYWSSSEISAANASGVQFANSSCNIVNGRTVGTPKGFNYQTRAIRTIE